MTEIISKQENIDRLLKGLSIMADTVGETLGPCGSNVILQKEFGTPHITKDGVSVARSIKLDGVEGIGASLLKEVASKSELAGDGTSTSIVLANEIAQKGIHASLHANKFGIKKGIELACKEIVKQLKEQSISVDTSKDIYNVAYISSNRDEDMAQLFEDAYNIAGKDGVIVVDKTNDKKTTVKHADGIQFDRGFYDSIFINNLEKQECRFENPNIVFIDGKMTDVVELSAFFQKGGLELLKTPLVVVAEDFDKLIVQNFAQNKLGGARVLLVKAPGFGDRRQEWTEDLAIMTGATPISAKLGTKLENFDLAWCGHCDSWVSDFDYSTIIGGKFNEELKQNHILNVKGLRDRAISEVDRKRHQERIARLLNGVVSIRIGGLTEVEVNETADRIDDALGAVKCAVNGGYNCGGGTALLNACRNIPKCKNPNSAEGIGYNLLIDCCKAPLRKICSNVGNDTLTPDFVVAKVIEKLKRNKHFGFDAFKCEFSKDMIESGIIDPTDVIISSLTNAVSVATLLLSSSSTVLMNKKEDK